MSCTFSCISRWLSCYCIFINGLTRARTNATQQPASLYRCAAPYSVTSDRTDTQTAEQLNPDAPGHGAAASPPYSYRGSRASQSHHTLYTATVNVLELAPGRARHSCRIQELHLHRAGGLPPSLPSRLARGVAEPFIARHPGSVVGARRCERLILPRLVP